MASLKWRCWSDEWAVFDIGSGQTHQMDTLTAAALMIVEAAPAKTSEITSQLSEDFSIPCDSALSDLLSVILARLEVTGLIEVELQ